MNKLRIDEDVGYVTNINIIVNFRKFVICLSYVNTVDYNIDIHI